MTGILGGLIASLKSAFNWSVGDFGATLRPYTAGAYAPLTAGNYFLFTGGLFDGTGTRTDYYSSTDGSTWTSRSLPTGTGISCAAFNGTTLLILSGFGTNSDTAWTTTNGTTWTQRDTGAAAGKHTSAIWDGTRFLVTWTDAGGGIKHSTDGTTWAQIDPGPGLNCIAFDGSSRYLAVAYNSATSTFSTMYICNSNPTLVGNWTTTTLPSARRWSQFVYGNNTWIAFSNNDQGYATSPDGTTWTSRTLATNEEFGGSSDGSENRNTPVFYEGLFYYWSGNRNLFSSPDGITWTDVTAIGTTDIEELAAWAVGGGKMIGAGYDLVNTNDGTRYYLLGQ